MLREPWPLCTRSPSTAGSAASKKEKTASGPNPWAKKVGFGIPSSSRKAKPKEGRSPQPRNAPGLTCQGMRQRCGLDLGTSTVAGGLQALLGPVGQRKRRKKQLRAFGKERAYSNEKDAPVLSKRLEIAGKYHQTTEKIAGETANLAPGPPLGRAAGASRPPRPL
eukprot:scaffold193_cov255-Pinguiococcus_pyrenoidosus.AAC.18